MKAFITGGASCGKSQLAENLCQSLGGNLVYLATMRSVGEEAETRIHKHRAQRAGKGFCTVECSDGLAVAIADGRTLGATALLEDLGNVVANRLFDGKVHADAELLGAQIADELEQLANRCKHLVVVGNEVGSDGTYYTRETQEYQQVLGQVARTWAAQCDVATECCCGIPQALKVGGGTAREPLA